MSSRSTLSAKSKMPSTVSSCCKGFSCIPWGTSRSCRTWPLRLTCTRLVCWSTIRTRATSSPARTSTRMSKGWVVSSGKMATRSWARYSSTASISCSVTWAMHSSWAWAWAATVPTAAATSRPRLPPVLGTTTLLTFLMMLPLTWSFTCWGSFPRVWRATAQAWATAMGSVHPMAGFNSSRRICTYA